MEQPATYKTTDRLIKESELETIVERLVEAKLARMLGIDNTTKQQLHWYDTEDAYPMLGLKSSEQLRIMVRDGTLHLGHEVRDVRSPSSQIPRYQFHIERCEARLSLPPEQRQPRKPKKNGVARKATPKKNLNI